MKLVTLFDEFYLPRGLVMLESSQVDKSKITVLTLDDRSFKILDKSGYITLNISDLMSANPGLRTINDDRNHIERIFTLGPWALKSTAELSEDNEWICYVDADIEFIKPLGEYLEGIPESANVIVTPHRHYVWNKSRLAKYGEYNVGMVAFKNNEVGRKALNFWANKCLEWCRDQAFDGKYADQKYLELFSKLFEGVYVDDRIGVNAAPWNVGWKKIAMRGQAKMLGSEPLFYFHFQGLKKGQKHWQLGHLPYLSIASSNTKKYLYAPYLKKVMAREINVYEESRTSIGRAGKLRRGSPGGYALAMFSFIFGQRISFKRIRSLADD